MQKALKPHSIKTNHNITKDKDNCKEFYSKIIAK